MLLVNLFLPTRNASSHYKDWSVGFLKQAIKVDGFFIDSSSEDNTLECYSTILTCLGKCQPRTFNHGATRNSFVKTCSTDGIYIFITQDAYLFDPLSLQNIVSYFADNSVSAVCGRQLPHDDANPIARHLRLFNYPDSSRVSEIDDISSLGMKAAFMSNSFAAYRASVFKKLGGFPSDVILGEDMYLAAKMLLAGYKIAYSAEACVKHSHNYTPWQEFKRYFDIGVFHSTESWIQEKFGGAGGEGKRFLISEFKYLLKHAPMWIPRACITNFCKILGYKLGKNYKRLPKRLRPKLSMHKAFWSQKER